MGKREGKESGVHINNSNYKTKHSYTNMVITNVDRPNVVGKDVVRRKVCSPFDPSKKTFCFN
jgi:hypothetical protein